MFNNILNESNQVGWVDCCFRQSDTVAECRVVWSLSGQDCEQYGYIRILTIQTSSVGLIYMYLSLHRGSSFCQLMSGPINTSLHMAENELLLSSLCGDMQTLDCNNVPRLHYTLLS